MRRNRFSRSWVWLLAAIVACTQSGCVQRRFTIRSNPPGALVYVDNYEIGTTPVSHDFVYYGTREIRLVKDGYETLTVSQPFSTPWYQYFPIDFFAENVVPGEIRDERLLTYQMAPIAPVSTDELLRRGNNLRITTGPSVLGVPPASTVQPMPAPVILPETLPAPTGQPYFAPPANAASPQPSPGYAPYP